MFKDDISSISWACSAYENNVSSSAYGNVEHAGKLVFDNNANEILDIVFEKINKADVESNLSELINKE